jgi:sacsin
MPATWNNWLFDVPVPIAWTMLLRYLACIYPDRPAFEWWPQSPDDSHDFLANAIDNIVKIIEKDCLPIFPTEVGYVTASAGLLGTGRESIALRKALQEAKSPVVYVPERLWHKIGKLFDGRNLCPKVLCDLLSIDNSRTKQWSDTTKQTILEYLLSEPGFSNYGALELFPFEDEEYRSISNYTTFVHRDKFEQDLFGLEDSRNIDLDRVSGPSERALKDGCEKSTIHPSIRYRSVSDFKDYCQKKIFKKMQPSKDMVVLDEEAVAFVSKTWKWIAQRNISMLDDALADIWLIPLTNGHYRKTIPRQSSSATMFAPVSEIGDLLRHFDAKSSSKLRHCYVRGQLDSVMKHWRVL